MNIWVVNENEAVLHSGVYYVVSCANKTVEIFKESGTVVLDALLFDFVVVHLDGEVNETSNVIKLENNSSFTHDLDPRVRYETMFEPSPRIRRGYVKVKSIVVYPKKEVTTI